LGGRCRNTLTTVYEDALDVRLGYYRGDLDGILRGLDAANLQGAVLELDGSAVQLFDFVEERTQAYPRLLARNRKVRGSIRRWLVFILGGGMLALPIEGDNLHALRVLAREFADPEIAICLSVRDRDGRLLVDAPDIGDSEVWVSSRLPVNATQAIRTALESKLDEG
jgi:hypothetical protein